MGLFDEMRQLERQQFFDGQRLFADDLQMLEAFHREMRWLHNQSLHQPGIGNGFAVAGAKGDREVTVGPGYASDDEGREIVLTETHVEPVPPVAGESDGSPVVYDLTVAYPPDEDLETVETRAGVCQDRGAVRLREAPVFCWVRLTKTENGSFVAVDERLGKDIETGRKIVLARAEVAHCQLNRVLSVAQRRSARPSKQPYIACGEAQPDWELVWLVEREEVKVLLQAFLRQQLEDVAGAGVDLAATFARLFVTPDAEGGAGVTFAGGLSTLGVRGLDLLGPFILPIAIRTTIDTCKAGFQSAPCYSARIEGSRQNTLDLSPLQEPDEPDEPPIL
jgi:hypothetical protein